MSREGVMSREVGQKGRGEVAAGLRRESHLGQRSGSRDGVGGAVHVPGRGLALCGPGDFSAGGGDAAKTAEERSRKEIEQREREPDGGREGVCNRVREQGPV